jgi:DNA end-binding protein Ku
MHFADELVDQKKFHITAGKSPAPRELQMASTLVENMTVEWDPERYSDDYRSALLKLIEKKIESGGNDLPAAPKAAKRSGKVIDLVSILQESLNQTGHAAKAAAPKRGHKKSAARKKAA